MNIRELLQTELWSKRTTRKILVWTGIVFVVGFLALGGWHFVEVHWLTRGERDAAKAALAEIDALQDAGSLSDEEFQLRAKQAEAKVRAAETVAITYRDNFTQMDLFWYLAGVELERSKIQSKKRTEELIQQGRIRRQGRAEENGKSIDSVLGDLKRARRAALHNELD